MSQTSGSSKTSKSRTRNSPSPTLLLRAHEQAAQYLSHNKALEAKLCLVSAIKSFSKTDAHAVELQPCLSMLSFVHLLLGEIGEAVDNGRRLVKVCQKAELKGGLAEIGARLDLANALHQQRNFFEGEAELELAFETLKKTSESFKDQESKSKDTIKLFAFYHRLKASYLVTQFRLLDAQNELLKAMSIFEQLYGTLGEELARSLWDLARIYSERADYQKAIITFERALSMLERLYSRWHPDIGLLCLELSGLYMSLGNVDRAKLFSGKAQVNLKISLGRNSIEYAHSVQGLASIYEFEEKYEIALEFGLQALKAAELALGKEHEEIAVFLEQLSRLYLEVGSPGQAEKCIKRANKIRAELSN